MSTLAPQPELDLTGAAERESDRRDQEVERAARLMRDDHWREVDAETADALLWGVSVNTNASLDAPDDSIGAYLMIEVDADGESAIEALLEAESKLHLAASMVRRRIEEASEVENDRLRKQHEARMRLATGRR